MGVPWDMNLMPNPAVVDGKDMLSPPQGVFWSCFVSRRPGDTVSTLAHILVDLERID